MSEETLPTWESDDTKILIDSTPIVANTLNIHNDSLFDVEFNHGFVNPMLTLANNVVKTKQLKGLVSFILKEAIKQQVSDDWIKPSSDGATTEMVQIVRELCLHRENTKFKVETVVRDALKIVICVRYLLMIVHAKMTDDEAQKQLVELIEENKLGDKKSCGKKAERMSSLANWIQSNTYAYPHPISLKIPLIPETKPNENINTTSGESSSPSAVNNEDNREEDGELNIPTPELQNKHVSLTDSGATTDPHSTILRFPNGEEQDASECQKGNASNAGTTTTIGTNCLPVLHEETSSTTGNPATAVSSNCTNPIAKSAGSINSSKETAAKVSDDDDCKLNSTAGSGKQPANNTDSHQNKTPVQSPQSQTKLTAAQRRQGRTPVRDSQASTPDAKLLQSKLQFPKQSQTKTKFNTPVPASPTKVAPNEAKMSTNTVHEAAPVVRPNNDQKSSTQDAKTKQKESVDALAHASSTTQSSTANPPNISVNAGNACQVLEPLSSGISSLERLELKVKEAEAVLDAALKKMSDPKSERNSVTMNDINSMMSAAESAKRAVDAERIRMSKIQNGNKSNDNAILVDEDDLEYKNAELPIPGDGNCFFNCLVKACGVRQPAPSIAQIKSFILSVAGKHEQFIKYNGYASIAKYALAMSKNGYHGGSLELHILTIERWHNLAYVTISIKPPDRTTGYVEVTVSDTITLLSADQHSQTKIVFLSHTKCGDGSNDNAPYHYNVGLKHAIDKKTKAVVSNRCKFSYSMLYLQTGIAQFATIFKDEYLKRLQKIKEEQGQSEAVAQRMEAEESGTSAASPHASSNKSKASGNKPAVKGQNISSNSWISSNANKASSSPAAAAKAADSGSQNLQGAKAKPKAKPKTSAWSTWNNPARSVQIAAGKASSAASSLPSDHTKPLLPNPKEAERVDSGNKQKGQEKIFVQHKCKVALTMLNATHNGSLTGATECTPKSIQEEFNKLAGGDTNLRLPPIKLVYRVGKDESRQMTVLGFESPELADKLILQANGFYSHLGWLIRPWVPFRERLDKNGQSGYIRHRQFINDRHAQLEKQYGTQRAKGAIVDRELSKRKGPDEQ